MRIVFFGTPAFGAEILRYLLEHRVVVSGVVTQPDRPKGRSLQLTPSPVKSLVLEKAPHIPLFQPEKASQEAFLKELADLKADLFVVVAFGQLLPQKLLDIPPLGCINVHPSLLPRFRGASPIHWALRKGDAETGVAIQKMVFKLDAGDVIAVSKIPLPPDMTFGELEENLCNLSKPLLLSVLQTYEKGIPQGTPQNEALVVYAPKIGSEEGEIRWSKSAQELHNLIRSFSPRPGAWCWVQSGEERKKLKILRSQLADAKNSASLSEGIVKCGEGMLKILLVQPEGKKPMGFSDWLRGQKTTPVFLF